MKTIVTLPTRREIRLALNGSVAAWAKARGHTAPSVHMTIRRYERTTVDMARVWGATRAILIDLDAAVHDRGEAA